MGLDMYLTAHRYISKYSDKTIEVVVKNLDLKGKRVDKIQIEIGYWRKANAIHKWFVDNVQEGEDDCGDYRVSKDQLTKLHDVCQKLLTELKTEKSSKCYAGESWDKNGHKILHRDGEKITNPELAEKILPTKSGFFYGSTDYDDDYLEDVKHTLEIMTKALDLYKDVKWEFYYTSSW